MLKFFDKERKKLEKVYPYLLVVGGALGLYAAIVLTIDKIQLLKEPASTFICDLNPILSCGSVMESPQAEAFGFANSILGIVGFSVLITIGMAILAGAKFKRWFWLGLQGGTVFGVVFVHWLIYQSIYRIGALCLYCMLVWTVTIPIFLYTTMYNMENGHVNIGKGQKKILKFLKEHHPKVLVTWYLVILGMITVQFWDFWSTFL